MTIASLSVQASVPAVRRVSVFLLSEYTADPKKTEETNRGAYLANALAHCGECHTPRNIFGELIMTVDGGNATGPELERFHYPL